ncbi:MAG: DUF4339 domain-containing protein [Planctomycetaceae bacterium]|nr:DUF4339 domain-containing protein [Planctomycetales bacterium]MCB9924422.1 DUF4339 domain-containing protein [Planctomycetaceae bacterium]
MKPEWYYQFMGETRGPFAADDMILAVSSGLIDVDTLVRRDNSNFVRADRVNGLLAMNLDLLTRGSEQTEHGVSIDILNALGVSELPSSTPSSKRTGATRKCPHCAIEVNYDAAKCRFCGEPLDIGRRSTVLSGPSESTLELIQSQRLLIYTMLVGFVLEFPILWLLTNMAGIGIVVGGSYFLARTAIIMVLATKIAGSELAGACWGLATLIPCIGLLPIVLVNTTATSELRKRGIEVGFMGARIK